MSLRKQIMESLCEAVFAIPGINGVIDDLPPLDYAEQPPLPQVGFGFGEARLPFAYIFEGEEQPDDALLVAQYECTLPVTVEVVYRYDRRDAARGPKRLGRELMASLQRALMLDPNRGGVALTTTETLNAVEESAADSIGVAVWKGQVAYVRSRTDPDSLEATWPE